MQEQEFGAMTRPKLTSSRWKWISFFCWVSKTGRIVSLCHYNILIFNRKTWPSIQDSSQLQMKLGGPSGRGCHSKSFHLCCQPSQRGIVGEIPQLKCSHVCFCAKWAYSADLSETDQWAPLLRLLLHPLLPFSSDSSQTMDNKLIKVMTA